MRRAAGHAKRGRIIFIYMRSRVERCRDFDRPSTLIRRDEPPAGLLDLRAILKQALDGLVVLGQAEPDAVVLVQIQIESKRAGGGELSVRVAPRAIHESECASFLRALRREERTRQSARDREQGEAKEKTSSPATET